MNIFVRFFTRATAVVALAVVGSTAHAADLTTQDYIDIEQLYATYNHAIDSGDGEAWAATFTPDGSFNTRFTGKEALVGFVKMWREKMNGANRRHWNSNLRITPSAEGANGTVMLMLLDAGTKPPSIVSTGMYSDVLVKTPNGWRFKTRVVKVDAPPAAAPAKP
jgi:hypothetical protein